MLTLVLRQFTLLFRVSISSYFSLLATYVIDAILLCFYMILHFLIYLSRVMCMQCLTSFLLVIYGFLETFAHELCDVFMCRLPEFSVGTLGQANGLLAVT